MKHSMPNRRHLLVSLLCFLLISVFQNCGQPGSIAVNNDQKITDLAEDTSPTPTSPPAPAPTPPPASPTPVPNAPTSPTVTYKDYQKSVVVNQSTSKVDVLVVIDNSGSMGFEQKNMAARFSSFMGKLQGLDWQIGIVTTDVTTDGTNSFRKDGRLLPFDGLKKNLISSTDDLLTVQNEFSKVIQRPIGEGSGNEQGIKATYRAIERALELSGPNVAMVRPGAALSVIVVTDADETAISTTDIKNKPEKLLEMVNAQLPGKTFKFNSIIVRDGDLACLNLSGSANEGYGKAYQKLTDLTSGVLGSVCESDYGKQLSVIGDSTVEMVRVVTLDCAPADSNKDNIADLVVKNGNNMILNNYTLNGRIVTFNNVLDVGSYNFNYRCAVQ